MLLSKNLFATFLAVAVVGVNGSPVELEKRAVNQATLCPDPWDVVTTKGCPQGGVCVVDQECLPVGLVEGACVDLTKFDKEISTVQTGPSIKCRFFL